MLNFIVYTMLLFRNVAVYPPVMAGVLHYTPKQVFYQRGINVWDLLWFWPRNAEDYGSRR